MRAASRGADVGAQGNRFGNGDEHGLAAEGLILELPDWYQPRYPSWQLAHAFVARPIASRAARSCRRPLRQKHRSPPGAARPRSRRTSHRPRIQTPRAGSRRQACAIDLRFVGDVALIAAKRGRIGEPFRQPLLVRDVQPLHQRRAAGDLAPVGHRRFGLGQLRSTAADDIRQLLFASGRFAVRLVGAGFAAESGAKRARGNWRPRPSSGRRRRIGPSRQTARRAR